MGGRGWRDSHAPSVAKDAVVDHTTYIEEPVPDFDYLRSDGWAGADGNVYKVEAYVRIDPSPDEYGRDLYDEIEILIDLR